METLHSINKKQAKISLKEPLYLFEYNVLFLYNSTQMLYNINIVMCYSYNSFWILYFTEWFQIFFSLICWSPNRPQDKFLTEKYIKHVLYIPKVLENFFTYFSRCSTKRLKSKVFSNFLPYSTCRVYYRHLQTTSLRLVILYCINIVIKD